MTDFEKSWLEGFIDPIPKKVITFADKSRKMKMNNKTVDPETIYQRVMGIQMSERTLDYKEMFSTELNTFAPSLFNDDGTMRLIEDKSKLKRDIQVTIPARCVPKP